MTTYLVDTENVHNGWRQAAASAGEGDEFLFFYSPASPKIGMDMFGDASLRGVGFRFIPCAIGENAMDFQLCTELGRQVCLGRDREFVILSGDKGFDFAVDYWSRQDVAIRREGQAGCAPEPSPFAELELPRAVCMAMDQFVSTARKKSRQLDKRINYVHCRVGSVYPGKRGRDIWFKSRALVTELLLEGADVGADVPLVGVERPEPTIRTYLNTMEGLDGVDLRDGEAKRCANILAHAMRQPANRRLGIVCSQFRSCLGNHRGLAAYGAVKPLILKWGAEGAPPVA